MLRLKIVYRHEILGLLNLASMCHGHNKKVSYARNRLDLLRIVQTTISIHQKQIIFMDGLKSNWYSNFQKWKVITYMPKQPQLHIQSQNYQSSKSFASEFEGNCLRFICMLKIISKSKKTFKILNFGLSIGLHIPKPFNEKVLFQ